MSVRDVIQAAAGAAGGVEKTFVEDVFQTYLYTGNGSTQTINNGIDLAGKGGLVWSKIRSSAGDHCLNDSARNSFKNRLVSNSTSSQDVDFSTSIEGVTSALSNGFVFKSFYSSPTTYVSWTFRKAPKFFDVVTWTGDGSAKTIAHSLGSAPGMIIVKCLNESRDWVVYHRSLSSGGTPAKDCSLKLNLTNAVSAGSGYWNNTDPTETHFTVGPDILVNGSSGQTYVAYLFAHDTTTDGLIQCGSFTTDASGNAEVTLGWEPQYVLVKRSSDVGTWIVVDNMRGFDLTDSKFLYSNLTTQEQSGGTWYQPTSTGFKSVGATTGTLVYMAIRRGPMRTPTDGTKVFKPVAYNGTLSGAGQTAAITTDIRPDMVFVKGRSGANATSAGFTWYDRLRSVTGRWLMSSNSNEETGTGDTYGVALNTSNTAVLTRYSYENNYYTTTYSLNAFTRAPGFFDVVCYTGTGAARTVNHNLGVAPELMIVKSRSEFGWWNVYAASLGNTKFMGIQIPDAAYDDPSGNMWNLTSPTATQFSVKTWANTSGSTFVAYLFASCPGVSKVFSFTGNGSSQIINCGFTNGARLVLIKRTDDAGDWYVWDTARGIVDGNDPHLSLNTTAAEVTTDDTIDPASTGFIVNHVANTNVNVNGASYIGLAIA